MIEAIISDAGGVFIGSADEFIINDIAKSFDISKRKAWKLWNILIPDLQTSAITENDFWRLFSNYTRKDLPASYNELFTREYTKHAEVIKPVYDIIHSLKKSFRLGLITNTIKPHAEYNLKRGIFDIFDIKILSCEVGLRKPDERIYILALKKLKVMPAKCIFIDDNNKFLKPAKKLGINTIHYKSSTQLIRDLRKFGICV